MKIVIPGGTGQVGSLLASYFSDKGHEIIIFSRSTENDDNDWKYVNWDGKNLGKWVEEINGADIVINLAGKNVNCRYNDKNKKLIMNSRVDSTNVVGEAINTVDDPPKIWLQASTATIYAHTFDQGNDEFTGKIGGDEENAPRKWDFSVEVAKTWEETAESKNIGDTRLVKLRTSLVMSPDKDGIFDTLTNLVRFGLGGSAGSGKQFVSWIHHLDFCRAVEKIIENQNLDGPVNLTAPNPLPYNEFMKLLRDAYGRSIGLPATKWMLEIGAFIMRTETELILKSRKVIPSKLQNEEFIFEFPNWEEASKDLVHDLKNRE